MATLNFNGTVVAPSMSSAGWLVDAESKYDQLLSCFLTTNINQGAVFGLDIISCASIIAEFGNIPELLRSNMQDALQRYLSKHYAKCEVTVSLGSADFDVNSSKYAINITVSAFDYIKGTPVFISYARIANFSDSKFAGIVKINNG